MSAITLLDVGPPWIIPGHVMERLGNDNPNAPHIVVLEVDVFREGERAFVARTCNVHTGTFGPTTTAPIYESSVCDGGDRGYRIIGVLPPRPKANSFLYSVVGDVFKVINLNDTHCLVGRYDMVDGNPVTDSPYRHYVLDDTFWGYFKVFWPKLS